MPVIQVLSLATLSSLKEREIELFPALQSA
jgi:hypothetical protein